MSTARAPNFGTPDEAQRGDGQYALGEVPLRHGNRMTVHSVGCFVGALFLIVTPGLILGVTMKDISTGIALSAALATVANFVDGFFHHHSN